MENRNTKEALKKDIDFLDEIKENAIKWNQSNDYVSRDMLYKLIDDWRDELSEDLTSIEESVFPKSDISSHLTIEQIECITFTVVGQLPYRLKHMGKKFSKLHPMNNIHGKMCIDGEYYEFVNDR
jgi:hypothetical protein